MTMRKLRYGLLLLGVLLLALAPAPSGAGVERWTPFGPSDAPIVSFAVDPAAAGHLVAGLFYGGVIRSTDGGISWRPAGLDNERVIELAASPAALYAFTESGKLYAAEPGGRAWRKLHGGEAFRGLSFDSFARLAVGRGGLLFLGLGYSGLYRSQDGGRHWQLVLSGDPPVVSVAIDPAAPTHVYAGVYGEPALFKSTDAGQSWTSLSPPLTGDAPLGIEALAIAPASPSTIYAGATYPGLYRSRDGGATWTKLSLADPLTDYLVTGLTVDPADARTVYVAMAYGTWTSRDGGATWAGEEPSPFGFARALTVDARTGTLYGASFDTVARNARGGRSWETVFFQADSSGLSRSKVVFDPVNPASVYLLGGKSLRSDDAGRTWSNILLDSPQPDVSATITDLVFHPDDPDVVYAPTGGLLRSDDHGRSWTGLTVPDPTGIRSLTVPGGQTLVAGAGCGIFRSVNGGASWRRVLTCEVPGANDESGRTAQELWVDPEQRDTIYAEVVQVEGRHPPVFSAHLFRSRDEGRTWRRILFGSQAMALDPEHPRTIYAVQGTRLMKSLDGGDTWSQAGGGLPYSVSDLRIDRVTPATLYASTRGSGVLRSTDGGATWLPANTGLDPRRGELEVSRLDLHPTLPHHLYAAVTGGVVGIRFDE